MGDSLHVNSEAIHPLVRQDKIDEKAAADELPEVFEHEENEASTGVNSRANSEGDDEEEDDAYDEDKLNSTDPDDSDDEGEDRASWGGKLEFLFTCIGYAVGLGNVWRFPYLAYKNGGGAFLVPYILMLALVGLPLFFMELSFGQFASLGPITIWKMNPLLKGLGYAMVSVSWLIGIYYNVVISHVMLFLFASFASLTDELPWVSCNNAWNTEFCISPTYADGAKPNVTVVNATANIAAMIKDGITVGYGQVKENIDELAERVAYRANHSNLFKTPAEEYYNNYVLEMSGGIDEAGGVSWKLALCLLLSWIIVLICLIRGIQSLGKVVYFTALFPYLMLTILLIRGVSLPGAIDGIVFYLYPDFGRILDARVWCDAATQIFYSLSACSGGLIAMSSYNKFNNNVLKDSLIVALVNCGTSIYAGFVIFSVLGFMAHEKGVPVSEVAEGGPGLAFIVYPEALSRMPVPQLWAICFFFMMATLGFGSQFSIMEAVLSAFSDEFAVYLRNKWRTIGLRVAIILFTFLMGLPMVTRGGIYLLNLVDYSVSGFPLLIIGLLECVALNWIYGHHRFAKDIEMMIGHKPNIYWKICWKYATPLIISLVVLFNCIYYKPPTLDTYEYPVWATNLGWCIGIFPIFLIVSFFLFRYCKDGGWDLLQYIQQPKGDWGPALPKHRTGDYEAGGNMYLSNIYIGPRPTITLSPSKSQQLHSSRNNSLQVLGRGVNSAAAAPLNLRVEQLRHVASRSLYKHHSAEAGIDTAGLLVVPGAPGAEGGNNPDDSTPMKMAYSEQQLVKYPKIASFKNALSKHFPAQKKGRSESKV